MPQAKRKHTTPDPIFARIADHKAKLAAKLKAEAALKRLEAKLDGSPGGLTKPWPPLYLGNAYAIHNNGQAREHVLRRLRDVGSAFGPKTKRKINALAPFARREIVDMLAALRREHARRRTAVGLTAHEKALHQAVTEWGKARRRMVSTTPRTPAGAVALADVLATFNYADADLALGTKALARAVAMVARKR